MNKLFGYAVLNVNGRKRFNQTGYNGNFFFLVEKTDPKLPLLKFVYF